MNAKQSLNLLIIGGSGFVSGTLARTAVSQGHRVTVVTRGQRPVPSNVAVITADRRDRSGFAAAIAQAQQTWDLVVDCIGYNAANAEQDIAVFRHCAQQLVFISTDFVYDPAKRRFPQTEESDHYAQEGYGGQKRQAELALLNSDTGAPGWTVLRPCHIYGPGSLLGCLPNHSRDADLLNRLQRGEALELVGGGYFLQQPIFAADLAQTILSCAGNPNCHGQIYVTAGPEIIESRTYYQIIADTLGTPLSIKELAVDTFLAAHPERRPFIAHRIYDLTKLREHGLHMPGTSMRAGLQQQVASLMEQPHDEN